MSWPRHTPESQRVYLQGCEQMQAVLKQAGKCERSTCDKDLAYPGARFCGAACAQRWEAGDR